jgi:hypothetical protein
MDARPLLQFLARAWGADPSEIVARPPDKARAEYEFGAALAQAHEHAAALEHFTAAGKLQPAAPWGPALRDAERKSRDALSRRDD